MFVERAFREELPREGHVEVVPDGKLWLGRWFREDGTCAAEIRFGSFRAAGEWAWSMGQARTPNRVRQAQIEAGGGREINPWSGGIKNRHRLLAQLLAYGSIALLALAALICLQSIDTP